MKRFFKKVGAQVQEAVEGVVEDVTETFKKDEGESPKKPEHVHCEGGCMVRGELEVEVIAARDLPDTDNIFFNIGKLIDKKDVTDPFVTGFLGPCKVLMTSVKDNTMEPVWNEKFQVPVCHVADKLTLRVQDKDHAWAEAIGDVVFTVEQLKEEEISGWFDILNSNGKKNGELEIAVKFLQVKDMEKNFAVNAYFPMRSGCKVDLYSCARNSPFPVQLSDGESYQPGSCYLDMYKTIVAAEKFIYITGWSVWTDLHLVRGDDAESLETDNELEHWELSLGELLKMKAECGVRVLVMIWSEYTSGAVKEAGMMGTHDMETFNFFKGTSVECALVSREVGVGELTDVLNNQLATASYTHHQKTIIADSPGEDGDKRSLTAFVGGLDVTDGRYDMPEHPLFKSILGKHKDDFYQNSAPGVTSNHGPRQPWQDIHAKLKGKVALDVMKNFVERWTKQVKGKSGSLFMISPDEFETEEDIGDWNVQLLRSITDDSVSFSDLLRLFTLTVKKSRKIEDSIARGYVKAIRAAEHYIYIENQYFLGSAYAWSTDNQINCHHTIPAEIAEKIVDKIQAGEQFCAYIVIPLHPEGDPATAPIQEILAWQRRTMAMMYKKVAQALAETGSDAHPQDYLLFLCPVNKESSEDVPEELDTPSGGSKAGKLRRSKRFMIYVHSKLIIVDDSLAILGSANINQRSLAGSRDTEIAVSVHQPEHVAQEGALPSGDVARFRLRVMEEHLGRQSQVLVEPGTVDCTSFIRDVCQENFQTYISAEDVAMEGHLILYPMAVSQTGEIGVLDGVECFPDTDAKVAGAKSAMLPMKLTT